MENAFDFQIDIHNIHALHVKLGSLVAYCQIFEHLFSSMFSSTLCYQYTDRHCMVSFLFSLQKLKMLTWMHYWVICARWNRVSMSKQSQPMMTQRTQTLSQCFLVIQIWVKRHHQQSSPSQNQARRRKQRQDRRRHPLHPILLRWMLTIKKQ